MRRRPKRSRPAERAKKRRPRKMTPRQRWGLGLWIIGIIPAYAGLLLVVGSAIYLPSAASAKSDDIEVHQSGAPAMGEIVEIGRASTLSSGRGGGSTTYYPVTEQVIRGVQTTTRWTDYDTSERGHWVEGRQLPLLYDTGDSTRLVIDTPEASGLLDRKVRSLQRVMLIGAPASLVGFGMLFAARRLDPDPREKRKRARAARSRQLRRRTGTGAPC